MTHNAYAALAPRTPLVPFEVTRRDLRGHDVALDVLFSGICHSDIHQVDEDWGPGLFPMVPGHEIVGVVTAVGPAVSRFRVGERVGVGTFVDSCRSCRYCVAGDEQYCVEGPTGTYNSLERDGVTVAYGGYADRFVVDEAYAVHVADSLDPAGVAPLMCAGITLYSPLRHWGAAPGVRVGIVGLGGLGHMGVKFAHALGAETTVFSHSPGKVEDAARLGADHFVTGVAAGDAGVHRGEYDLIINTVSADLDLAPYFDLLKVDGTLVVVGLPSHPYAVAAGDLVNKRRALAGSMAGGTRELQEMLDFCAQHDLTSDVEVVPADYINTAYQRTLASDVKYRFVIDASTITSR
ncbi:MAG: NAD(P)-dependent alcohol dehydrogenase [Acidobacteriota bacterium]|nr:NAD(P)-dependent alcohol dehydrogenase [Acidobacteriota bacterium]